MESQGGVLVVCDNDFEKKFPLTCQETCGMSSLVSFLNRNKFDASDFKATNNSSYLK